MDYKKQSLFTSIIAICTLFLIIILARGLLLRLELKNQIVKAVHSDVTVEIQGKYKVIIDEAEKDALYSLNPLLWRQIVNFRKDFPIVFIKIDNMTIGVFMDRENTIMCNNKYYYIGNTEYEKLNDFIKGLEKK